MRVPDSDYFATRLNAEWRAASDAACEESRAAHQALADIYTDRLIRALDPGARPALRLVAGNS